MLKPGQSKHCVETFLELTPIKNFYVIRSTMDEQFKILFLLCSFYWIISLTSINFRNKSQQIIDCPVMFEVKIQCFSGVGNAT